MGKNAVFNKIYPKRGLPFSIRDYPSEVQELWMKKCRLVDEIVDELPTKFTLASGLLGAQTRGLLRALSKRKDFDAIEYFGAFLLEPYEIFSRANVTYRTFYCGPVERLLNDKMNKTVHFIPKQYTQVAGTLAHYAPQYCAQTASVPDENGYINLGLNSAEDEPYIRQCIADPNRKVILEINCHTPWIAGDPKLGDHKVHLSEVDFVYEHHEPLFQLPITEPTDIDKRIAEYACDYIKDGATLQLGIGGIPNYLLTLITERKNLGVHTEMLTDGVVDIANSGALTNACKGYRDGYTVCGFVMGTDRLYDWVDRNPAVQVLPICEVNAPEVLRKCQNFVSVNAGLMIDLNGQICSESIGFRHYSGPGGQCEFVLGAQLAANGRSIICLKSSAMVKGQPVSNILGSLPPGASVTVPRFLSDAIISEYGVADLRYLSRHDRARALVNIAHPDFQDKLIEQAKKAKIWDMSTGFEKVSQKMLYGGVGKFISLKKKLSLKYWLSRK